jgi:integrase/recombinase XerC
MTDLIDRHLRACAAAALSPITIEARAEILHRLDRDLPEGLERALTEELQAWLAHPGWSPKTRETYWCHIVAFYRDMTRRRQPILSYDPSADLPRPRVGRRLPRVASDDQLELALANLARPALRAVILAAGVGMRAAEVAGVEGDAFTRERVRIHGKGDAWRSVPVPPDVWQEIRGVHGPVILYRGQPVSAGWLSTYVSQALTAVGLPTLTMHYFRGAYATRLRRAGVDTSAIARLLGHTSVATTQRYIEIVDADLDQAVARLPALPISRTGHEPGHSRLVPRPSTSVAAA